MKTRIALAVSSLLMASPALTAADLSAKGIQLETQGTQYQAPAVREYNQDTTPRFLVKLQDAPIAAYQGGVKGFASTQAARTADNKLNFASSQVQSYASHLKQQRQSFANRAAGIGAKVETQFDTLFNGVSVAGKGLTKEQLQALPGVAAVYEHALYHVQMDASRPLIHVPEAWELVGGMAEAGKGIKVAIIDSGIRPEHPMFSGEGFTAPDSATLPDDDYCASVDESFCNNKLIVARYSTPTFAVAPDEHLSPLGYGGHGTHVAGTAVGNSIMATYNGIESEISGVAPGAYLMSYKALYAPADDIHGGSGSNIMLLEALEMAVKDGADVINNSWGGSAGADPAFSPYVDAFTNAEAAGVVIATSAGNSGSGAQTVGCPGCIEAGITVANTTHGRFFAKPVAIGSLSDLVAIEGTGQARLEDLDADLTAPAAAAMDVDADNFEGCAPFAADSFKGKIAVISRGACAFADKATNAADAGATGMVVYNNRAGQPITMSMDSGTIPSVMIDQADGAKVLAEITAAGEAGVDLTIGMTTSALTNMMYADNVAATSSRGPNGDASFLKPDLAAPGTDILSAWSKDDPGSDGATFAAISGTSMASPHVAGAAALMKQAHPEWSAIDIKTALTSSTEDSGLKKEDADTPADAFDVGAGRMEVADAISATVTFDKASLVSPACLKECSFELTVNDKRDASDTSEKSYAFTGMLEGADISFDQDSLSLAGGASGKVMITVDSMMLASDDWHFGQVQVNGDQAHLPLVVYANSASGNNIAVAATSTTVDQAVEVSTHYENQGFDADDFVTVRASIPAGTKMVAGSAKVDTNEATQTGFDVNEDNGTVAWTGRLKESSAELNHTTGSFGYGLKANGVAPGCDNDGCDEVAISLNLAAVGLPGFKYLGQEYTSITMSDNGMAIAGGGSTSGTWNNRELPDSAQPNNILAPFWTDMDLNDGTVGDSGGGNMYFSIVGDGTNDWLVLEWADAQVYNDNSGNSYTFQIWLQLGDTEGVHFEYAKVDALPANLTVGIEDISGSKGVTLYHNGTGDAVAAGDLIEVFGNPAGSVDFAFDLMVTDPDAAMDDAITVDEDSSVDFSVTDNDSISSTKVLNLTASAGGLVQEAIHQFQVASSSDLKATVTEQPENGTVTMKEDGSFSYAPNADFVGADSFSYSLMDGDTASGEASVAITVENVNDAPTITASNTVSGAEGSAFSVALSEFATDIDGDTLTWTVTQTGGTDVEFTVTGQVLSMTLPADASGSALTFAIAASDAEETTDNAQLTVNITDAPVVSTGGSSDSSSLGFLALALSGLAFARRRKAA
ncbi:S8 family serine peptidase [Ferrimonas sp. SCSIO 43195]|uniref:S8 family serine peptidase n=1 Tax=Ferrimonas sp. SCSIO 43195 TaxID=2822844 RepID=UPI00218550CE|nr:S8 family serine peptidase [Ferrimonas sp. SCSIO 43195]USD36931.1 S8 family serine peptidase [Ferrimonas sp. SCSIO 43195]